MTVSQPGKRSRRKHKASIDIDFCGTARTIPSSPSSSGSDSSSSDDVCRPLAITAEPASNAAAGEDAAGGAVSAKQRQQQQHSQRLANGHDHRQDEKRITSQEWGNMALLVLLYAMQGIPLGLTMGAM